MFDFLDLPGLDGIETDGGFVLMDTTGDGIPDTLATDTTGDGIPDTFYFDTTGDGLADTSQHITNFDATGDGYADTTVISTDFGMDGNVDMEQIFSDTTGDGAFDMYSEVYSVDTTGDGIIDSYHAVVDTNFDGVFDIHAVIDGDGGITLLDQIVTMQNGIDDFQFMMDLMDVENFNPNAFDPDSTIGDPTGAMHVYYTQEAANSCAVASQGFVIHQLTGQEISEAELSAMAEAYQWYVPEDGTFPYNVGNILLEHGLTVSRGFDNSIDDIANVLENGGGVIVSVDIYEMYSGDWYAPGMGANHAIQVTGIDNSDPGNPMVIVNDPGIENGAGAMVSIDTFMSAWETGGNFMVSAYA